MARAALLARNQQATCLRADRAGVGGRRRQGAGLLRSVAAGARSTGSAVIGRDEEERLMPKKVRPIPKGYHSVTANLTQADSARTIAFCKQAFGAKERMRVLGPGGKIMHAEMQIGDSIVMLTDA